LQNPKTFISGYPEKLAESQRKTVMQCITCNYLLSKTRFSYLCCCKFMDYFVKNCDL